MTDPSIPQWLVDYEAACWAVWPPEDLVAIARKRRARNYVIKLDCATMEIKGLGPISEGAWSWYCGLTETIEFIDAWIQFGGDSEFLDWLLGHIWCLFDMPRNMPPLPKESFERGETQNG